MTERMIWEVFNKVMENGNYVHSFHLFDSRDYETELVKRYGKEALTSKTYLKWVEEMQEELENFLIW